MKLAGRRALITGASQGIGKAIAEHFLENGASMAICARDETRLAETAEELRAKCNTGQKVICQKADIARTDEIDALYETAVNGLGGLDIVVNNAGVQGPIGSSAEVGWAELEHTVQINLMGTIYSMRLAVMQFRRQGGGGKIINLSGGGATAPMPHFLGYAVSKAGLVRATETFAKETYAEGIYINALAPGALNTRMLEQVLAAGEQAAGKVQYEKSRAQKESGGASMEDAAGLAVFLASDESAGISGRLISAVWDNWKGMGRHKKEISESDIYTLRRIIPADRGFDWD